MKKMMMTMALAMMMTANMSARQQTEQNPNQQRPQMTPEQMVQQRSQRIAHKMGLSDEQTKKFSDIYADYSKEKMAAMQKNGKQDKAKKADRKMPKEPLSDKQLEQMHKNRFASQRAMLDVEEKYYKKFRSVLTERQYSQLMKMNHKKPGKHFGQKFGKQGKRFGKQLNKKGKQFVKPGKRFGKQDSVGK